jgi:biotin carboxyl carrier protein
MKYITEADGQSFDIEMNRENEITVNGETRTIDFHYGESYGVYSLIIDNQSYEVIVEERDGKYQVLIQGTLYEVIVEDERARRLAAAGGGLRAGGDNAIRSPMPGLIVDVVVSEGDAVAAGQTVVILESMKMQNELKAAADGVVAKVSVKAGENVEQNKELVVIVAAE